MRSTLRYGLLSVILAVMIQGQVLSAQEKKVRPDRPQRAKQAAQNQDAVPGAAQVNRLLNQLKTLDLTPDQDKAIRELVQKSGPRAKAVQEAVMAARKGLDQAVVRGADEQAIRPVAQKLTQALVDQAMFQARIINTVNSQLTPAQLEKLNAGKNNQSKAKAAPAKAKPEAKKARDPQKVRTRANKNQ